MFSEQPGPKGEIEIAPGTTLKDDEESVEWLNQVAAFCDDLRDRGVPIRRESRPAPGEKGEVATIIVALGSAGAFTAALTAFRDFLTRERHRTITVTMADGSKVTVDGDTDNATMERLTQRAIDAASG